jgi:hypothetical protein
MQNRSFRRNSGKKECGRNDALIRPAGASKPLRNTAMATHARTRLSGLFYINILI